MKSNEIPVFIISFSNYLKKVLSKDLYNHFVLFHAACTCKILCSVSLALKFNEQAKIYLTKFVQLAKLYYGEQCQILNVYSLIYLADDVRSMRCSLSRFTAFSFENMLGKIKKWSEVVG